MLNLTDDATTLIHALVQDADLPAGAGLRLAQRDDHTALAMTLTSEAGPDDFVVREGAAVVFLGPVAAARVAGQTLDAQTTDRGSAFFLRD
jgi:Fe-S cluster assembly iron-binding protein IscA